MYSVPQLASNAYGAPYAKNAHFRPGGFERFCLLGDLPSPSNHKFLVSCAPCGRLVYMEYDFISQQFYFRVDLGLYA